MYSIVEAYRLVLYHTLNLFQVKVCNFQHYVLFNDILSLCNSQPWNYKKVHGQKVPAYLLLRWILLCGGCLVLTELLVKSLTIVLLFYCSQLLWICRSLVHPLAKRNAWLCCLQPNFFFLPMLSLSSLPRQIHQSCPNLGILI